jgi:hypothetical protein
MPFDSQFDDIYKLGIKATCEELNAYCERLDEQIFEENMLDRIYNQINKADIIIADLTGKNANVFYETGYAHALNKKVILLTKSTEDIPFDLKHHLHIVYNNSILTLKEELRKYVSWYLQNPEKNQIPNELTIKLFINGTEIEKHQNIKVIEGRFEGGYDEARKNTTARIKIDVLNDSNEIYNALLKIGILVKNFGKTDKIEEIKTIRLSENEYIHVSDKFPVLYPHSWESFSFSLITEYNPQLKVAPIEIIVRIFTEVGIRDIPVNITYEKEYRGFGSL